METETFDKEKKAIEYMYRRHGVFSLVKTRQVKFIKIRNPLIYYLYKKNNYLLIELANIFNIDHATILYSIKKHEQMFSKNPTYNISSRKITKQFDRRINKSNHNHSFNNVRRNNLINILEQRIIGIRLVKGKSLWLEKRLYKLRTWIE